MGIIGKLLKNSTLSQPSQWLIEALGGKKTAAGVNVNEDTAMRVTAVFACVKILAETIASLPLPVYERLDGGGKRRASDHRLYSLLHDAPNPEMTSFEFRETMQGHLALRGNAYAEKEFDRGGRLIALWPLRPDKMTIVREGKELIYEYLLPDGITARLRANQVFHLRGLSSDGIVGLSPIAQAREAIGMALATEEFGARFFGDGAHPGGIVEHPGKLDDEAYERFKASVREAYSGLGKSHRIMILEDGVKYHQVGIAPEEAQFITTRKFQVAEIARIYRIPLHLLDETDKAATYASVEQFALQFVVHTIRPWLVRWEQRIHQSLFTSAERQKYFAEFLVEGLLRGDSKARAEYYAKMFGVGAFSINQILELENMNPIGPEGDKHYVPVNMMPADKAAGGQQDDSNISNAFKRLLADALNRVMRREEADIMREARKQSPETLGDWVEGFYENHKDFVQRQVGPVFIAASEARNIEGPDIEDFTERYVESSKAQVLHVLLSTKGNLLADLQGCFDNWKLARAKEIAAQEIGRLISNGSKGGEVD